MMTMAQYAGMLKDVYQGPVRNQLRMQSPIYDRLNKSNKYITADGKKAVVPIQLARPRGQGAALDGKPLPAAGQSRFADALIYIKHIYARIMVTGPTQRASESNKGAFAPALSQEQKSAMGSYIRLMDRMVCNGTGVGVVATVTGNIAIADTNCTVDSTVSIEEGDTLEVWTAPVAGGGTQGETVIVTGVTSDTVFTIASPGFANAYVAASTIQLINSGSKDAEITGLSGAIDDGSNLAQYQSIYRTTGAAERLWKAIVDDPGVSTAFSLVDLRSNTTKAEKNQAMKLAYYTTHELRDAYLAICQEQQRFVNTMKFDKGAIKEAITFDNHPIFVSDQMPAGYWLGVDEAWGEWQEQMATTWLAPAGSQLLPVSGYDMVEMVLCTDLELFFGKCNSSFSMRNRVAA